jgi:hypothetical protein
MCSFSTRSSMVFSLVFRPEILSAGGIFMVL